MSTGKELATGLTLREALERLVDSELLKEWQEKHDERIAFKKRAIAEFGHLPRGYLGDFETDEARQRRRHHQLRSEQTKALRKAEGDAERAALRQFYPRLAQCCVEGRKGLPSAPLTVIPKSALPALDGNYRTRLRIESYDESRMAFGTGEKKVTYYDVQVWLPDEIDRSLDSLTKPGQPNLSDDRLSQFLTDWVSSRGAGDPELKEYALLEAVKVKFPDHRVTRQRVRDWMADKMPPSKRFERGQKPTKQ